MSTHRPEIKNRLKKRTSASATTSDNRHISPYKKALEAVHASEERLRALFEATFEGIVIHDNGIILDINPTFENMFGYSRDELLGTSVLKIAAENTRDRMQQMIARQNLQPYTGTGVTKDGTFINLKIIARQHEYLGRKVRVAAFRDTTQHDRDRANLNDTHARLLAEQVTLRKKNTALKEIMNQIEQEKLQIRLRIQSNINKIVMPILYSLQNRLQPEELGYIRLLEEALADIADPFIKDLENRFSRLTPRELEVCHMVKNGLSSKDIALNLSLSVETVRNQRKNIRKKLGIDRQNISLVTYLREMG